MRRLDPSLFTNGRVLVTDVDVVNDVQTSLTGSAAALLPTYFPTDTNYLGDITLNADLSNPGSLVVNAPDFASLGLDFANFGLLDNILLAIDGIDTFLSLAQSSLDSRFAQLSLPLVGDQLAQGAQFIADLRSDFIAPLREAIENADDPDENLISSLIYDFLGPDGAKLLLKADGSQATEIGDIRFVTNINDGGPEADHFAEWDFKLGASIIDTGADINLDLGLPGLGFEADADVDLSLDWEWDIGFGLNRTDVFYIDIGNASDDPATNPNPVNLAGDPNDDDDNALSIALNASVSGDVVAQLGFLQLGLDPAGSSSATLAAELQANLVNTGNAQRSRLGFAELGSIGITAGLAASAVVDLDVELALSSDLVPGAAGKFPTVNANFFLDWAIGDIGLATYVPLDSIGNAIGDGLQALEIRDVTLELGSVIGEVLGPVLEQVQNVTEPFQPIIDILLTEIPVISDLFSPVTFLDVAGAFGNVDTSFIEKIVRVIDLINTLPTSPEEVGINFGSLDLLDPGSSGLSLTPWEDDFSYAGSDLDTWFGNLADIDFDAALAGQGASSTSDFISDVQGGGDFSFPLFEDPSQIFGLFLNRPIDLVYFDIPALDVGFLYENFIPVLGPLGVSIRGELGAYIDFHAVGYDTFGLQRFAETDFVNPLLILDGLYVNDFGTPEGDDPFGANDGDNPELTLYAGLSATAELNLGIARGGAEGGVFANIFFDLYDPFPDGKIRGSEVIGVIETELLLGANPVEAVGSLFDISGDLTARLFAFYELNLGFTSIREELDITPPITLFEFEFESLRQPRLASDLGGGVLQLNMGEFARERLNKNTDDIVEEFTVTQGGNPNEVTVSATLRTATGEVITVDPQTYKLKDENDNPTALTRIIARGGLGDDIIDLSGVTGNGIDFDLEGGDGDDTILAGTGNGTVLIDGGVGDDVLTGSAGADLIFGGLGADVISGLGGADVIFGDLGNATDSVYISLPGASAGDDSIDAGGGDDIVIGGGGDDDIIGGSGADVLLGDGGRVQHSGGVVSAVKDTDLPLLTGVDTILGNGGSDLIYAGHGNDRVDGGADADEIYGETGFDTLFGGSAADQIFGGTENDTIYGLRDPGAPAWADNADAAGDGADLIEGNAGNDTIAAQGGADLVRGGTGADNISGGDGADRLFGDSDPDVIHGDAGDDEIIGGAGSDQLFGETGLDVIHGNSGDDEIRGDEDADSSVR